MSHNQPKKAKYEQAQEKVDKADKASLTDDAEEKDTKMTEREITVLSTREALHCYYAQQSTVATPTEMFMSQDGTGFTRRRFHYHLMRDEENIFDIEVALAAIIGEEMIFGHHFDGSESDIEQATRTLKTMMEEDGSNNFGCMRDFSVLTPRPEKQNKYDELFRQKMDECEARVTKMLEGKLDIVQALAIKLAQKHNYRMGEDEIQQFFSQYRADQLPPGEDGEKKAMQ